jgi:mono/diheme cytochrome c family protein
MKRLLLICVACAIVAAPQAATQTSATRPVPADPFRAMLSTYCFGCHNSRGRAGGLALDTKNLDGVPDDAEVWEAALRKLRGRLMPPPGSPQPDQKEIDAFVTWLEARLDSAARGPKAGYVPVQRLNRTEYANAVKDLVGVDVKAKEVLPTDIEIDGFDNIAAALTVSPAFLDQYISAARAVARQAVGDPAPRVARVKYPAPGGNQASYEDGFPLGTRGGMKFRHNFPADGEYRFNILDLDVGLYTRAMETPHTVVLLIDGKVVFRKPVGGPQDLSLADRKGPAGRAEIMSRFQNIPVQVKAGVRDVVVTFIERSRAESDENVGNGGGDGFGGGAVRFARLLNGVEVLGPYNPSGVSPTPSRQRIFICDPKPREEAACARRIAENLARRAFRRPVTRDDIDLLMSFYDEGLKSPRGFEGGIEQVVAAVLASPDFLYRAIRLPAGATADTEFALSDLELASRLSFFLWSQGPDKELLDIAAAGGLTKPGVLDAQVRRMLADPRASNLVTSFAIKWLHLHDIESVKPDPQLFPAFTEQLRKDLLTETELFIASTLFEDRSVTELLTADYTFLNERLARHYGIGSVFGPQFRRVILADPSRRGLLGKGAVLLRTSYGDRTSPVLRGAWVLEKLMGTPPSPPPPDTATDLSQAPGEQPKTVRARLEQHRDKASCKQCHGVIDPIGLALENFDAIGQWREIDRQAKVPIDAKTVLPNGAAINGPTELRDQLAGRPGLFVQAFTEKLMMYALGRKLESFDMPQVRAVVAGAAKDHYRWSAIVLGIVNSDAFRKQAVAPAPNAGVRSAAGK